MTDGADRGEIRSIAVTADDVVAAFEANRQRGADAVLRATPPFSARMRARLHRGPPADDSTPQPLRIDPERLLEPDAVSDYPHPDDTADDLRADPDETYSRDRHREYHEAVVERWRERAREHLASTVTVETPDGPTEIRIVALG